MAEPPVASDNTPPPVPETPVAPTETMAPAEPPAPPTAPVEPVEAEPEPQPKPLIIDMPAITPHDQIPASPGVLTSAHRATHLSTEQARQMKPLLERLSVLRTSMISPHRSNTSPGASD